MEELKIEAEARFRYDDFLSLKQDYMTLNTGLPLCGWWHNLKWKCCDSRGAEECNYCNVIVWMDRQKILNTLCNLKPITEINVSETDDSEKNPK